MKIEIWSDVVCPFCYIGKRKFEHALSQFPNNEEIEIEWKSFQLSPDLVTNPNKTVYEFLSEHKGMSVEHAKNLSNQVALTAQKVGLPYNFDIAVPANSFNAHRLAHLAKRVGMQDEVEETLFKAYFIEGKNIDSEETLLDIAHQIGLEEMEVKSLLNSDKYTKEVHQDMYEAQQIGVRGVPFFVFDRKFAVSGAQESEVFLSALTEAYNASKEDTNA